MNYHCDLQETQLPIYKKKCFSEYILLFLSLLSHGRETSNVLRKNLYLYFASFQIKIGSSLQYYI